MEKELVMTKCTVCNGTGQQTLTVTTFGTSKSETHEIACAWCDGTGELIQKRALALKFYNEMWCECGEKHGSRYFRDGEHPDLRKHHYRCKDCGGVTQIG